MNKYPGYEPLPYTISAMVKTLEEKIRNKELEREEKALKQKHQKEIDQEQEIKHQLNKIEQKHQRAHDNISHHKHGKTMSR